MNINIINISVVIINLKFRYFKMFVDEVFKYFWFFLKSDTDIDLVTFIKKLVKLFIKYIEIFL